MVRRTSNQLALPIGTVEPPEELLREAHQRSRVPKSFEEAMQFTHFRIAFKRMAIAMTTKGRKKK